jgi:DivIVA domain-containing protein
VTSQGQRFRRRALRRGYKVDEVDAFLDRVESTLAGDPIGAPVSAQEVHDVVFRVRFGGYDEWQVDLHLDRVERQLAELEERGGFYPRGHEGRPAEVRMPPPERMGPPPERMVPPPERMGPPPMREERIMPPMGPPPMAPPPMPARPVSPVPPPAMAPPPPQYGGRYEEPSFGGGGYDQGFEPGRHGKDMTTEIRIPEGGLGSMGMPGGGDAQRLDQLRRTFQPRRFGSGYDRIQVDRLFDGLINAMAGRGPVQISESDLDPAQFDLVPGGYFEAEVDAALKEVRDILIRRR